MVDNPAACTFTSAISAVCPRTAEPGWRTNSAGRLPRVSGVKILAQKSWSEGWVFAI